MPIYTNSDDDYTLTIDYSVADNAGGNNSTITFNMTLKANTNWYANTTQTWGYLIVDGVDVINNWSAGTGTTNRGFTGTNQTRTVVSSTARTYTHNTDGSRSVRFQAGWRTASGTDDWRIFPGILIDQTLALTDYPRTPSAVSVESLSRSANGKDISLTSSTSTFYGSGAYYAWRWSYDNVNWSAGIAMTGRNGSGVDFNSAATVYVQVIAVDSEGNSGWSASASIAGISAPAWSTAINLGEATRGTFFSVGLSASPATSYELIGSTGTITGLSVASNGVLSGTPTTTNNVTLNVRAYNYDQVTDRNFSLTIKPALPVFSDGSVNSSARVGIAYSDAVAASETASYSVFSGALPGGLSLNTSTGAITGTPTTPGTFTFVLRATNVTGSTNTGTLTITVISAARVWNGTAFVSGLANVWNGSAFVTGTIRVWDGTTWKNTN